MRRSSFPARRSPISALVEARKINPRFAGERLVATLNAGSLARVPFLGASPISHSDSVSVDAHGRANHTIKQERNST